MTSIRKTSARRPDVQESPALALPGALSPDVAAEAARVMTRAEAMGLLQIEDGGHAFTVALLDDALRALAQAGIGRQLVTEREVGDNPRGALQLLNATIEETPHPATEWVAVERVLGADLTARLVGVSGSSMRRYAAGDRATPDLVAYRLHFLALVIADLLGSYNYYGVRRWFDRPRRQLGGRSPADALLAQAGWDPDDSDAVAVGNLARSLTSLGAA